MTADEARKKLLAAVREETVINEEHIMAAAEKWAKAAKLEVLDEAIPPYWAEHSPEAMIHLGALQEWLAELRAKIEVGGDGAS